MLSTCPLSFLKTAVTFCCMSLLSIKAFRDISIMNVFYLHFSHKDSWKVLFISINPSYLTCVYCNHYVTLKRFSKNILWDVGPYYSLCDVI